MQKLAAAIALLFFPSVAAAASPSRVAIVGPEDTPIVQRLSRNVASLNLEAQKAATSVCTRDVVERFFSETRADALLCTDGDQIGVWSHENDRVVLKEAVVVQGADDRSQELAAARAVMALSSEESKLPTPSGITIVAHGRPQGESSPAKDAPSPAPVPPARERVTPHLVLGAGPALTVSRDGSSFAVAAEAEIGVTRHVALVPWLQFVPANREVSTDLGKASFRPTLFGLGFAIPILPPSSIVVPRIGAGYAILWMHTAPESVTGTARMRAPEDLLAPAIYATAALSVKVASQFRVAVEGMAGTASHEMIVRIGMREAAHWGVPLASLGLRAEWVLP